MSDGTMAFHYTKIDAATEDIGSLVAMLKENTSNLRLLYRSIEVGGFEGSAGSNFQRLMNNFHNQLQSYDSSLDTLNGQMKKKAGTGGEVHQVDIAQGNRFLV